MKFTQLGLSEPLLKAVSEQGYHTPSPIQAKAIPEILKGNDVMAAAQTGTGKTAGFTLPLLEKLSRGPKVKPNQAKALVLTPTRELAAQVEESVMTYSKHLKIKSTVVFGGVKINPQMQRLRGGVDILVATPGRLLDLYSQNAIRFDQLEVLVLDEADRMLDMGFIHDIRKILKMIPKKRQNLLFSATFSKEIRKLAQSFTNHPVEISVNPANSTAKKVSQVIHPVDKKRKKDLLMHLVADGQWEQVLVFCRTKRGANRMAEFLEKYGINAAAIHGNKSQGARTRALSGFKSGTIRVLVATDIAARGIDIDQLPYVVNVDLPNVPEDYVHRIGRTGRAGEEGHAISLVSADEFQQLFDIEKLIGKTLNREFVDGFVPNHDVPESKPVAATKPKKIKRPKPKNFVKASVKAKWAKRSEEENQSAKEKNTKAKRKKPGQSPWEKASSEKRKTKPNSKKRPYKSNSAGQNKSGFAKKKTPKSKFKPKRKS
jgi:ATP-dependent RNA helicase RhlE